MNYRFFLMAALWLAAASACLGGTPTNRYVITCRFEKSGYGYVAVTKGRLTVGKASGRKDNQDAPDRWYILGTKIKSSDGGGYLAYDPTGKDNRVFLTAKPTEGTEWSMILRKRSPGDEEHGVIRAATGPRKGWYLDVEETEENARDDGAKTVRRLVLVKEPIHKVEAGRIYIHR
jgi:hypothetical protein